MFPTGAHLEDLLLHTVMPLRVVFWEALFKGNLFQPVLTWVNGLRV